MADIWPKAKRSAVMKLVKSRGNKQTELELKLQFRRNKISGWRRHLPLPGKPDFAFPKKRIAVFVDGCFWHGCPRCYKPPKSNQRFWREKLLYNQTHDKKVNRQLRQQGWKVIRIWQHALQKSPQTCLNRIRRALEAAQSV
jgi:DNA mismatch endonuclease (patch repair protein)